MPLDGEIIDLTGLSIASSDDLTREFDHEMSQDAPPPWYHDPDGHHPFSLTIKGQAKSSSMPSFTNVEFFPWADMSLEQLWNGENYATTGDIKSRWSYLVAKWRNTAAMCGGKVVRVVSTLPQRRGHPIFQIALPEDCRFNVCHVKWGLNPWNLHPLLLYVHSSVLHVFDAEARSFLGCIRGHGGDITSLGVHRLHPHLFFTTSRDCTTRIYDLRITTEGIEEQLTAPRHPFGMGIDNHRKICALGKCIVVLTGGRSGGHEAAVLGADFHMSLPLIATCGMDHALRIWHLGPTLFMKDQYLAQLNAALYREDKPLFSSTTIHDARVLSVYWLSHETLMSHSAPRITRVDGRPVEGDSGTLIVWQWLSVGRFFPPGSSIYKEAPLRGCISDYRESSSFKLISNVRLPVDVLRLSLNRSPHRPPLILLPVRSKLLLVNACHLPARNRPILFDDRDLAKLRPAKRVRLAKDITDDTCAEIEGWSLSLAIGEDLEDIDIEGCAMSPDGQQVAAVGPREGMWIWQSSCR